ncbi:VWA domain-containing protein [Myxococcota bacterium]|nr:VWA domain-containing protein [Myxococcota bacterium]
MPDLQVSKIKGVADIVFCLDVTGSMQPCIDGLKRNVHRLVEALQSPMEVQPGVVAAVKDWRAKVYGYRDIDADGPLAMIEDFPMVQTAAELRNQLEDPRMQAAGGGDEPESLLDALYRIAKNTPWRGEKEAHRFVVVFTDATPKPSLHPSTVGGAGPTDLPEVLQALNAARIKPVLYALKGPETETIQNLRPALLKACKLFTSREEALAFFSSEVQFATLVDRLAATVTASASEVL